MTLREKLNPYSTLIALIALMLGFEMLGRVFSFDVKEVYAEYIANESSWADLSETIRESLFNTDLAFLNSRNLTNLTLQVAINGILAVGMTLIIITGGIDLSVGSVVAFTGIVLGLTNLHFPDQGFVLAFLVTILSGAMVGAFNGTLISRFKIPPFVITLGMLVIARGLALIFSNSTAISPMPEQIRFLGSGFLPGWIALLTLLALLGLFLGQQTIIKKQKPDFIRISFVLITGLPLCTAFLLDRGLPFPIVALTAVAALGVFISQKTVFGRSIYAIGGNERASVLSGIKVGKVKFWVYTIMGALAALAGIILAGRLNSATPTEGQLMELDAIASVVIGGTSLQGGIGTIQGAIIGAFIIGALNNGMDMLEISSNWQMVTKGLIIIFAVYSDARLQKKG